MISLEMEKKSGVGVEISCTLSGNVDALLDELAAGMAHAIMVIADDLPVIDEIHESLARVMASRMIDQVRCRMDLRGQAKEKTPEA